MHSNELLHYVVTTDNVTRLYIGFLRCLVRLSRFYITLNHVYGDVGLVWLQNIVRVLVSDMQLWLVMCMGWVVRAESVDYDDIEEKPVEKEAEFTSIPAKILVNQGETIRLPCFVDKIEGYVLLWKFGDTILSVGGRVIDTSREGRMVLEEETNGNFLVINEAASSDGGDYMCQISAYRPKDIVHSVMVRTRPKVQVEEKVMIVKRGEEVKLKCNIKRGHPVPEVSWRKEGGDDVVYSKSLVLSNLTSAASGVYLCRGDNGHTADHTDSVKVIVQGPPVVDQSAGFIHASQGGEVPVHCQVLSHPPATVQWYKGEESLSSTQYNISQDTVSGVHTLLVHTQPNISTESEYSCVATNKLGTASKKIILSSRPATPVLFVSHDDDGAVVLNWEVLSWPPVTSYQIELTGSEYDDKQTLILDSTSEGTGTWSGQYTVQDLVPGTQYKARVSATSEEGSGPYSNWLHFHSLATVSNSDRISAAVIVMIICSIASQVIGSGRV